MSKLNVVYIAGNARCEIIKAQVKGSENLRLGTLPGFGEPTFFDVVSQACSDASIAGAVLFIPDILETYGKEDGASKVAALISASKEKEFAIAVVDPGHAFHAAGRTWLVEAGARVADEEHELGIGFPVPVANAADSAPGQIVVDEHAYDYELAEEEKPVIDNGPEWDQDLFGSLMPKEQVKERIPGMRDDTPDAVEKEDRNPFSGMAEGEVNGPDPFAEFLGDEMEEDDGSREQIAALFGNPVETKTSKTLSFDDFENLVMSGGDIDAIVTEGQADPFSAFSGDGSFGGVPSSDKLKGWANKETLQKAFEQEAMRLPRNAAGEVPLDILLEHYGYRLSDHDFKKIQSMMEPSLNYDLEHDDGIGRGGLMGLKGKTGRGISQVGEDELAESNYISEQIELNGHYFPPDDCKIVSVWSGKGGPGKTTVSVMIATQLNWYFNPEVMQRLTTAIHNRILIISFNEFDDLPVHGIGYDGFFNEENETDNRNALELLDCIEAADGRPMWGDISHCFVATDSNRIFYLPSLTQREELGDGAPNIVTAENYKKIIDVCSQFFSFIVIDTPDTFYHDRDDLVTFAFSIADVIAFVIEADLRNTTHLYHFIDAIKDEDGNTPLDKDRCLLVVNKYVSTGNPYMPIPPIGQIKYSDITKKLASYFARFIMIPYTQPRAYGNVLHGTDAKVKKAAGELADAILEIIDENDASHSAGHHDIDLW